MGNRDDARDRYVAPGSLHSKQQKLEYVSDLLLELKEMVHNYNLSTLEGMLDLARAEARLRSRDLG